MLQWSINITAYMLTAYADFRPAFRRLRSPRALNCRKVCISIHPSISLAFTMPYDRPNYTSEPPPRLHPPILEAYRICARGAGWLPLGSTSHATAERTSPLPRAHAPWPQGTPPLPTHGREAPSALRHASSPTRSAQAAIILRQPRRERGGGDACQQRAPAIPQAHTTGQAYQSAL